MTIPNYLIATAEETGDVKVICRKCAGVFKKGERFLVFGHEGCGVEGCDQYNTAYFSFRDPSSPADHSLVGSPSGDEICSACHKTRLHN
jgi:hypothetical protein